MLRPSFAQGLLAFSLATAVVAADAEIEIPQLADPRLQITLYASDPDIVTPIGAAVDAQGRLFVLESHTHLRPRVYDGPELDRILIFDGEGADGRAERVSVFADDIDEGMTIAFSADGTLYVCAAKSVFALHDRDGDGRADARTTVLSLDTAQLYPHSQLLALTFSPDGWLYVTRGNVGGRPYAWVGSDGRRLEGYGDGGDVVRCRPDGTQLERVATGFWNAFDLRFDAKGRLLLVDNDPDSRGPNRLIHIVKGGDYGYRSLYGPSGLHPYQAWEGELPGTLPYAAGVGEAPSGLLDCSLAAFPADYRDTVLVTVWGEHNVTRFRLQPNGASLTGIAEPFLRGGRLFRPVAFAPAPDGSVFLTDWMLSDYPNHGRGRVWKISARPGVATNAPRDPFAPFAPDADRERLERLTSLEDPAAMPDLHAALRDEDPFVRHAAEMALSKPVYREAALAALDHADARIRLGALLALRRAHYADPAVLLAKHLADPDGAVRQMALVWTGERVIKSLLPAVEAAVEFPGLTPRLFETWLATMHILQSDVDQLYAKGTPGGRIPHRVEPSFVETIVHDERRPALARALALARLTDTRKPSNQRLLLHLARDADLSLQQEALRSLASSPTSEAGPTLLAVAFDRSLPERTRGDAVAALGPFADAATLPLLDDPSSLVRTQAVRALRFALGDSTVRTALEKKLAAVPAAGAGAALGSDLRFALGLETSDQRPATAEEWRRRVGTGGDIDAGRRAFFSSTGLCIQCHRLDGRGGTLGPDLSVVGRTANRTQLIQSIVNPSAEVAPQYQGWQITTHPGEVITGLQGHYRSGSGASIVVLDGGERLVSNADLKSLDAMTESLMPAGLENTYSVEEFRDLLAFLESLR